MAKPCSLGTIIFLTYAILCFLHSVTPKEMTEEQENDSVPSGEEVQLKKCDDDDMEGCDEPFRVGRRDTASETERRGFECPGNIDLDICHIFIGRKRRLSRGTSSYPEILSRRDGVKNPLVRALRSKLCPWSNPWCRGPAGKKKYLRETAVPKWKLDTKNDDPSKEDCKDDNGSDWLCYGLGKRMVPTPVDCDSDEESFNPECRLPGRK